MTRSVPWLAAIVLLLGCSSSGSSGGGSDAGVGGSSAAGGGGTGNLGGSAGSGGGSVELYCEHKFTDSCICIEAGGGNQPTPGETCTPETVGSGVCCADSGYPGGSNTCNCQSYGCFNGSICTCGTTGGTDTACNTSFAHCCVKTSEMLNPTSCHCTSLDCNTDETEVTSCGLDIIGCGGGAIRVDKCTP